MDTLWPASTAVLGIYDHPAPDGSGITSTLVERSPATEDFYTRQALKTARALTRVKDYLSELL